ncbi:MAG: single-stranded-DNA-specific exonuclease RecJ [Spirochaetes bacterium]|nr:single-stranded-DNA-specific exonuclease RecJ [Spirochaetota bacterium]
MKSAWQVTDSDMAEVRALADACGIDMLLASILYGRGMRTPVSVSGFLNPCLSDLHSPFLLDGMHDAVARIKKAVSSGEKIAIFSDSDIDGITSLAIIHNLLKKLKSPAYRRYPRDKEGYGLMRGIVDEFRAGGITLVITVDCGIRDISEIEYARDCGIDFIVTDHHEPDTRLPAAILINPKLDKSSYPFKELAGVGVAFKLAHAMLWSYQVSYNVRFVIISSSDGGLNYTFIKNGIVTVNDPLEYSRVEWFVSSVLLPSDHVVLAGCRDEVKELVSSHGVLVVSELFRLGNKIMDRDYRSHDACIKGFASLFRLRIFPGMRNHDISVRVFMELQSRSSDKVFGFLREYIALVAVGTIADIMPVRGENRQMISYGIAVLNSGMGHAGLREITGGARFSSRSISWDIAPLLNTPGRMGVTDLTVEFFLTEDPERTRELIAQISELNRERKKIVSGTIEKVKAESTGMESDDGFFYFADDSIKDGLAGLIANRIADDIKKPVIIMSGPDLNGHIKGSGRSYGRYNFLSHVEPLSDMFERLGGHAQAFGFTIRKENIDTVMQSIARSVGKGSPRDDTMRIDAVLDHSAIDSQLIERLSLLEPYGRDNEEPIFLSTNISVSSFQRFGADSNHGKYIIGSNIQAIGWHLADLMHEYSSSGRELDIVYKLENNRYQNRLYPRMLIIDIDYSD